MFSFSPSNFFVDVRLVVLLEIENELIYPFEKNYCKDCGKDYEEISDLKEDIVNEKTGEVTTEIPHFCNLNSPFYP